MPERQGPPDLDEKKEQEIFLFVTNFTLAARRMSLIKQALIARKPIDLQKEFGILENLVHGAVATAANLMSGFVVTEVSVTGFKSPVKLLEVEIIFRQAIQALKALITEHRA